MPKKSAPKNSRKATGTRTRTSITSAAVQAGQLGYTNPSAQLNPTAIRLGELESMFLSAEEKALNQCIAINEEADWKKVHETIRKVRDDQFKRKITGIIIATLLILLLVPIIFPDRGDVAKDLLHILLPVFAGMTIEKIF